MNELDFAQNDHNEIIKLFGKELLNVEDITLLILKGHIITEFCLNALIKHCVDKTNSFKERDFTFAQKLKLAKMAGLDNKTANYLNTLNQLRNSIAHSLAYNEDLFNTLAGITGEDSINRFGKINTFKAGIAFLCGSIHGTTKGLIKKHITRNA